MIIVIIIIQYLVNMTVMLVAVLLNRGCVGSLRMLAAALAYFSYRFSSRVVTKTGIGNVQCDKEQ